MLITGKSSDTTKYDVKRDLSGSVVFKNTGKNFSSMWIMSPTQQLTGIAGFNFVEFPKMTVTATGSAMVSFFSVGIRAKCKVGGSTIWSQQKSSFFYFYFFYFDNSIICFCI